MQKTIVFRSGSLRMGGLERVLIEVLQNIDKEKYNIKLIIDDDCGKDNIFESEIPKEIDYYFLKSKKLIKITENFRNKKKNIFYKLLYNIMMFLEIKIKCFKTKKLIKVFGKISVLIDFDAGASKYIDKLEEIEKKVVWIHNSIPKLKKKKGKIERFGKRLNKYDKVVAICDEMKEELRELYPYLKNKLTRIYNPFNFERILNLSENKEELTVEEIELLKEKYYIMVSRLDTVQKDFETLLEAFRRLKEAKKGLSEKLYIVGEGPSRKEIEELIDKKGLKSEVRLLGRFKNPYVWIKNSQFLIHSSKYEGFGLVLVEAAILDKLVISSNCPVGPKEILENGKSGILFNTGNVEELKEILEKIFLFPEKKEKYILEMKKKKQDFNQNIIIKEYEKLIESILV